MVQTVLDAGVDVHTIRDITRGGLATVATELAEASGCRINLEEEKLPVSEAVKYGKDAVIAGEVTEGTGVYLLTALGSYRKVLPLRGEGLPRIC